MLIDTWFRIALLAVVASIFLLIGVSISLWADCVEQSEPRYPREPPARSDSESGRLWIEDFRRWIE